MTGRPMEPMTPVPLAGLPSLDFDGDDGGGMPQEAFAPPSDVSIDHLTGIQKAAIMVHALAEEQIDFAIDHLPEALQMRLVSEVSQLGPIDPGTREAVKQEFIDRLSTGGAGGLTRALDMLSGSISSSLTSRLRAETQSNQVGDPWGKIGEVDPEVLLPVIEQESTEIAAVIVSKLSVSVAASLLGMMPGDRARRITYGISLTSAVSPDVIKRLGRALTGVLAIQPDHAFEEGPVERVGAILNFSRSATRDTVLEGLDETDKSFAEEVRKAIFTFANIPARLDPRDVPKIVRVVDQEVLTRALAAALDGSMKEVGEFILEGLSQRMADSIRDEIQEIGSVDEEEGEEAMGEVVNAIRQLEADGEISLVVKEEVVEEDA